MKTPDPDSIKDLTLRLEKLSDLRKQEEEEYNKILTLLDETCRFALPAESHGRLNEVREALNGAWDVSRDAYSGTDAESNFFWKQVSRRVAQYLQPFVSRQREFNSLTVHLLNEFIEGVTHSLTEIRHFQCRQILYFQRIIPVIDSKDREVIGIEDKNLAYNLIQHHHVMLEHHDLLKWSAHDDLLKWSAHGDFLFQELDKKLETLRVDFLQQQGQLENQKVDLIQQQQQLENQMEVAQSILNSQIPSYSEQVVRQIREVKKLNTELEKRVSHADTLFHDLDKMIPLLREEPAEPGKRPFVETGDEAQEDPAKKGKTEISPEKLPPSVEGSNYYDFEEVFRGPRETIKNNFAMYMEYFQDSRSAPILDLGCGRGEFLELLREAGIYGIGVDVNPNMVQKCRDLGLDAEKGDLLEFLLSREDSSLGGIFCSQVVEHLHPDYLVKLLEIAWHKLKEGAPLLLETVNVSTAHAFLQIFTRDITHCTPLHPDTLKFLVAACGFQNAQVLFTSPLPVSAQMKLVPGGGDELKEIFNQNMSRLNTLLYGFQEYAVLGIR